MNFAEISKYRKLASKGIPFRVVFDPKRAGFSKEETKHYLTMLGFENTKSNWIICTILGELENMKGHYVVLGNDKFVSGLHADCFFIDDDL